MCTYIKSTGVGSDPIQQTPYAPPLPPTKIMEKPLNLYTGYNQGRGSGSAWIRINFPFSIRI